MSSGDDRSTDGWLRRLWRTLRFRLAVWNALVVVLTAGVTLLGLRQGVQWALLHEMDQILIEDVHEIALALEETRPDDFGALIDDLERKALGHKHHGWFVELRTAKGDVVWSSIDAPVDPLSAVPVRELTPRSTQNFRLVQRTVPVGPRQVSVIRVGARLELMQADMARVDQMVFIAAGGVLLLAPLCGYWLASRAARAVGEIIQTASRLRPTHLDERLPVRGTGDELDQLAETVNGLLDRIAAYLQQRRDFVANSAHELRTPLAAIRSSVEVALSGGRSPEEYEDLLVDIIDQSGTLETLVNQLLLLSETEVDQLRKQGEPVAFDDVVTKAVEMFRGVAESRHIDITLSRCDDVNLVGNRTHLRQVVNNLVDNAVKYTLEGGHVDVELVHLDCKQAARLTVRDTGIGISVDDLQHVFERFFRADRSRSREHGITGTGLGLCICQAVAVAHGGTITCESQLDEGTCVTVTLPLKSAGTKDQPGHTASMPGRLTGTTVS
ncbi:Signal transduction histidine-protein kinase BaeS [Maioricimonas rarisocia]|uniref:histidine kinase n=1 Tax=Maioricimonas rarisocia TaxID=2528026 RepID=A0A517Z510_9PLAN|nr:HAMP domain-containing sensor histidine kinase [Maioricimonas rarisocia]QDU37544.1 Signal transduction histidine-protein kinase BaeS [Maioricimonas rarisocia]